MQSVSIAVDVQGGDYGARVLVGGILEAQQLCSIPLKIYLCGNEELIRENLKKYNKLAELDKGILFIENCPQIIEPGDIPSQVWKSKKSSSIVRCITLQKDGVVQASLSAGDTRVLISAAMFLLGRSKNVSRPALAALLPTTSARPTLLLDVGANLDCRVEHLVSFAYMGYEYVRHFFSIENPSVALLNIGQESSKGTKAIIEAAKVLAVKCRGYHGFIEGDCVLTGTVDVIVCDGFVGNVLLKACESFHVLTESVLEGNRKLVDALKKKMTILNAENYGAAPLLGLQGVVLKAHGSSSSHAISQALLTAVTAVEQNVVL